jgi:dUTP pyrophosphatase
MKLPEFIEIKLMRATSKPPIKKYMGDAGYDVFNDDPSQLLGFGERVTLRLGFAINIPPDWFALIQEKSGMARDNGLFTIGNVVDRNYRGELHATICCMSHIPQKILHGQKVAQMILVQCYTGTDITLVDEVPESNRGTKGFGSSGL